MRYKILILLLITLLSFSVLGCSAPSEELEIPVESVQLNVSETSLTVGENFLINATILPNDATFKTVIWSSSDESVVTVNEGYITAVSEGVATVTAKTLNNLCTTCIVTVSKGEEVTEIYFDNENVTCEIGEEIQLLPKILPIDAYDKTLTWSTSDVNVVVVEDGLITAIASGTATITATTTNGLSAECFVTVQFKNIDIESIALNFTTYSCKVGESFVLSETILPSNATNTKVFWESSDNSVAIVSNGTVVGVGLGIATISVTTENGKSATCLVTVLNSNDETEEGDKTEDNDDDTTSDVILVERIELPFTEKECVVGESFDVVAIVLPNTAVDKTLTWSSYDQTIATVTNGHVKPVGIGNTVITVQSSNGIIAEFNLSVLPLKEFDSIFEDKIFVFDGQVKSLVVENVPENTIITYQNNDQTNIGDYEVFVKLEKSGYVSATFSATLKIVAQSYEITYVLNCEDATNNNPSTFQTFSELELLSPESKTFDFVGWYLDDEFKKPIKYIAYDCFENITIYAKWENRYEITGSIITTISKYAKENVKALTIPSCINGVYITGIGDRVFENSVLETVTIPKEIVSIGQEAFATTTLKVVNFEPNSRLKTIGESAFSDTAIESIIIPKSVESFGESVFECCYQLQNVVFEYGSIIQEISPYLFYECVVIETIYIPKSVERIADGAFYGCDSLKNVYIYRKLQNIGDLEKDLIKYLD